MVRPRTDIRPRIVAAARTRFLSEGVDGASLRAIARERERGTLEQLIVSPVRPVELMIGKIMPFIAIGYVQMTLVFVLGRFVFDVPIVGSMALLYALALVFIAANLALGLLFSTLAKTQQQAMQMSFFFILPNILLSGFMFPFEAMPEPAASRPASCPGASSCPASRARCRTSRRWPSSRRAAANGSRRGSTRALDPSHRRSRAAR